MRLCYALGYYVIGPLLKWWVRGVELRAHAGDILAGRGEVAEAPEVENIPIHRSVRVYRRIVPSLPPEDLQTLIAHEREMRDVPSFERLAGLYLVPTKED